MDMFFGLSAVDMTKKDSVKKSLLKTISWRLIATLIGMSLVYFYTKKIQFSLAFGLADFIIKFIAYYTHDRIWKTYE